MKKITFIIIALLSTISLMAQTPNAFKYQAVARTSEGVAMSEQNISVQISILESSSAVYTETHDLTTSTSGLFTLNIGEGTSSLGDFESIDWSTGTYSVEVSLDENAGSNYTVMGTSPLLTVPYAMHAKTAENAFSGEYTDLNNTPAIPENTSELNNDSGFITSADDADADATNEIQDLSEVLSENNQANAQIKALVDPTEAQDAATKAYVDALIQQIADLESILYEAGLVTVSDYEGNVYSTVKIGDQIWTAENIRSTRYSDGTPIPNVTDNSEWSSLTLTESAYCWYDNDSASYALEFGALYNYEATVNGDYSEENVQGVCPDGWHIPSYEEWNALGLYLGNNGYNYDGTISNNGQKVAKSLASTLGWTNSDVFGNVGNDQASNNSTGFNAKPAGFRDNNNGVFYHMGTLTGIAASRAYDETTRSVRKLNSNYASLHSANIYSSSKGHGYSVRCIKD
jgi:uncharacterized protein (TIGR02145 family)